MDKKIVPIEVSARHIHLSPIHLEKLFGTGYQLKKLKLISQPGQYSSQESVQVVGPKNKLPAVRIVGPARDQTQLELSISDCLFIGIKPVVKVSGDLSVSAGGVKLIGPVGEINLDTGVIVSQRHLHISPAQASAWGLKHLEIITIKCGDQRSLEFNNVVVRSRENIDELSFMLDTDEANAAGVKTGDQAEIIVSAQ